MIIPAQAKWKQAKVIVILPSISTFQPPLSYKPNYYSNCVLAYGSGKPELDSPITVTLALSAEAANTPASKTGTNYLARIPLSLTTTGNLCVNFYPPLLLPPPGHRHTHTTEPPSYPSPNPRAGRFDLSSAEHLWQYDLRCYSLWASSRRRRLVGRVDLSQAFPALSLSLSLPLVSRLPLACCLALPQPAFC